MRRIKLLLGHTRVRRRVLLLLGQLLLPVVEEVLLGLGIVHVLALMMAHHLVL